MSRGFVDCGRHGRRDTAVRQNALKNLDNSGINGAALSRCGLQSGGAQFAEKLLKESGWHSSRYHRFQK